MNSDMKFVNRSAQLSRIFVEPVQVGFGAGDDGQSDEFGDFVAVETFYFPFEAA
jgi:hypothetical protein